MILESGIALLPEMGGPEMAPKPPNARGTPAEPGRPSITRQAVLADLDQLQRLVARALDHHRARVTELVGLLEEPHALAPQLGDPGIEIADAERDVIVQVSARAHEGRVALTHVRGKRHVTEHDGGRWRAEHPVPLEGRPAPLRTARNPAGGLAQWRLAGAPGEHRRV